MSNVSIGCAYGEEVLSAVESNDQRVIIACTLRYEMARNPITDGVYGVTSFSGLRPLCLPSDQNLWKRFLSDNCDALLREGVRIVTELKAASPLNELTPLAQWNDVSIALANAGAMSSLFAQIHPDEDVRAHAALVRRQVSKVSNNVSLDEELYSRLNGIDVATLDDPARRVLQLTLRSFRRTGVGQAGEKRRRLHRLREREAEVGAEFSRNIRQDVRSVFVDATRLSGLPQDWIDAHPPGDDGKVEITTERPDCAPVIAFCHDPAVRRKLFIEYQNRGWPTNDALLKVLLELREERAGLLGYPNWSAFDAEIKMTGSESTIERFIAEISAAVRSRALGDKAVLLERLRRDDPDAVEIDEADVAYYAELVRRERFGVDARRLRSYFELSRVRQGLLDLTGRLFGLTYTPVEDAPVWHPEVTAYDVYEEGRLLGRIYLDLHPRQGKLKQAAHLSLVTGVKGRQLAEGVLVANVPHGLIDHGDVVTLFHEFGHLLHHVLAGQQEWMRLSGTATERDFIEVPSLLLEEWAWNSEVLRRFARNSEGETIPAELVADMRAAHEFGKGYMVAGQLFYAAVSYWFHKASAEERADLTAMVKVLHENHAVFPYVEGTHIHASFLQLKSYTSGAYTYTWSLVIAKDLFSAFDENDLFAPVTAGRYRDLVLAQGGARDAADLISGFLGRPHDVTAFVSWLNEVPGASFRNSHVGEEDASGQTVLAGESRTPMPS